MIVLKKNRGKSSLPNSETESNLSTQGFTLSDFYRKCVVLIIDGLGDLPVSGLDDQTPLEAAHTPVLNRLAASGLYGLVDPIGRGEVPNTHSGCGVLLGVLPGETSRNRRGPIEASGAGLALEPGDIAVRANFATLENHVDGLLVSDRRAGRITSGTDQLAAVLTDVDLGEGVTASLQPTDQHRGVLVLSGPGLDQAVSDTDPGDHGDTALVQTCQPKRAGAEKTAEKINLFVAEAHRRLNKHPLNEERVRSGKLPANGVLTRGAGEIFRLEPIFQPNGLNVAVVAGCNTVLGLARILGFEAVTDPRFTASFDTDLDAKMRAVLAALDSKQLVYLHVKAPDLFAHDLNPVAKRDFLERLDKSLQILYDSGAIIALAADHTTDSNTGVHTADPVPALIYDPRQVPGEEPTPVNFGEAACRNGSMPRRKSHDFLLQLVRMMEN
jgi:2,3-bisphosphoglycerate-independent phosphoglycerate mutase